MGPLTAPGRPVPPRPTTRPRRRSGGPLVALRRHPRLRWLLAALPAAIAGLLAVRVVGAAEAARERWGDLTTVLVAERDVQAGAEVAAGDLALAEVPRAVVPDGALRRPVEGRVARSALHEGEIVVAARIGPEGLRGVAALVGPGERGVAIPVEAATAPAVQVGDLVDVLVAVPADAAGDAAPGFVVVERARVVAHEEGAVTVAVGADDAPRVAVALAQGAVSLALVGG